MNRLTYLHLKSDYYRMKMLNGGHEDETNVELLTTIITNAMKILY